MGRLRVLLTAGAFGLVSASSPLCPAADPTAPVKVPDTLVLKDGRIIECPKAEKQADGSYKLTYEHGDIVLPAALVKLAHLQGAGGYEPKNDEEKAKIAQGLVPYEGEWIPKADRDARAAKKAAEAKKRVADAKLHHEWKDRYKVATANFQFEFTIAPDIAKSYMDLMETYYSVFSKDFRISRPPKEKLKVCFYHDYDTFLQVGGGPPNAIGYYKPFGRRELNFYYDRLRPDRTTAVMFHETQHYLSHLLNLKFWIPHNFSEAFAEYYGGSAWDPAKKSMATGGLQEGRISEIQTDIARGERPRLDKFLRNQLGYDDYTWGWSFVHFMMETPRYAPKFKKFYIALPTAKDIVRTTTSDGVQEVSGETIYSSFKKYMGIEDIAPLEREWYEYVDAKLKATSVVGLEEAGISALYSGRHLRAKRMFKEAIDKGSTNPEVYFRYGKLLSGEEAIPFFKKGLELDPLYAALYLQLGQATRGLKGAESEKEGKRLIQLALDLAPDDVQIWLEVQSALESDGGQTAAPAKEGEDAAPGAAGGGSEGGGDGK